MFIILIQREYKNDYRNGIAHTRCAQRKQHENDNAASEQKDKRGTVDLSRCICLAMAVCERVQFEWGWCLVCLSTDAG